MLIEQQKVGDLYINQPEIKAILALQLKDKILPKIMKENSKVYVYNGTGITYEDITKTIKTFDDEVEKTVLKLFKKYIQKKNQLLADKMSDWLKGNEQTLDTFTFKQLQKKINNYENNNK